MSVYKLDRLSSFEQSGCEPTMLYGAKYWPVKNSHVQKMKVAEMRLLRWMCGHIKRDKIKN